MKERVSPRKRDSEATRLRIIEAARIVFTDKGYDAAGTREIARLADVNVALLTRYYGSKKQLFEEAILPAFDMDDLMALDIKTFCARVADAYTSKGPKIGFDPMLALIRSASSDQVGQSIRDRLTLRLLVPLAEKIGGEQAKQKAALVIAQLGGFDLFGRIIGLEAMGAAHKDDLRPLLESALERLIEL